MPINLYARRCNEDNHDNLTHFHANLLCEECANAAGVLY